MLNAPTAPTVELINLEVMSIADQEWQRKINILRDYYEGKQGTKVPSRLLEFMPSINQGFDFSLNVCSVIIQAVTEHLNVRTWDSKNQTVAEWAANVWMQNGMDALQDDVHESALVESCHYVIVSWDNDKARPVWTPTRAFTSAETGGDDFGCRVFYTQNDPNQDPLYAVKKWTEVDTYGRTIEYKTVYFPERIEKYYRINGVQWLPRATEGESWPVPWVDDAGQPLGIPVIEFINKRGASELEDILGIQDAANKTGIDTLISSDSTAFRIYVALGWIPTSDGQPPKEDGSNIAQVEPGTILASTAPPGSASFTAIDPPAQTIQSLIDLTQQIVVWGAVMTGTPPSRVITTKLIASDETLKQQEEPLESRVALRRALFGRKWVMCMDLSRKLQNMYGEETIPEDAVNPLWGSRLSVDKADLEAAKSKKELGIPKTQIWRELGYSEAKIAEMLVLSQQEEQTTEQGVQDGQDATE